MTTIWIENVNTHERKQVEVIEVDKKDRPKRVLWPMGDDYRLNKAGEMVRGRAPTGWKVAEANDAQG